jgi:hypothetical protein
MLGFMWVHCAGDQSHDDVPPSVSTRPPPPPPPAKSEFEWIVVVLGGLSFLVRVHPPCSAALASLW